MKKLHLLVVLVAGTMAFYSCQKLIDLVPKKDGDCEKGNTEQCEGKGSITMNHKGKVEIARCGVLFHTQDKSGNPIVLEPEENRQYCFIKNKEFGLKIQELY